MEQKEMKDLIKSAIQEYEAEKEMQHKMDIEDEFDVENKYNNQIDSVLRAKKTLGVDAFLSTPNVKSGQPPLEMHAGYSRFVLTILDNTSESTKAIHANVHADEVALLKFKTECAVNHMINLQTQPEDSDTSPAYTVKLLSREFSGKTPAQVLLENESNREKLEQTRKWLDDNKARYPKNQEQIDAIEDALDLLDLGQLEKKISSETTIELYREDIKIPNANKLNEHGKTFVYSLSIICDPTKDFPFAINISNCYATPKRSPYGQVIADMSSAENLYKTSILLSTKEWYRIINKMDSHVRCFEQMHFPYMMELMKARSYFK